MASDPKPLTQEEVLAKQQSLASQETKTISDTVRTISSHAGQFVVDGDELTRRFKGIDDGGGLDEEMANWQVAITAEAGVPRYKLNDLLGLGAQGLIFSVTDRDCGRQIALKTMRGSERIPTQIARFVHEAQVTAQLEHPGIVPVHELNALPDGTLFYTMKQIEGRPLSEEIRLHARHLDKRFHFLQVFLKICDTMSFAHSHGVLHRDLKPANIMLGDYGEVLVLDWGLSKVVNETDVVSVRSKNAQDSDSGIYVTRDGHAVGTPAYMSPEQARGHRDSLDHRSDIYSLGVILYEILTQNIPYTGTDVETVLDQVSHGQIVPVIRQPLGQFVSPQLAAIVHKAMSFDVNDRYQSVDELAADLQSYVAGESVTAYVDTMPERFIRFMRRNRAQVKTAAILSTLFLLMISSFVIYSHVSITKTIEQSRSAGFYYLTKGMYDEAHDAFKRIIDLDNNDLYALSGLTRAKTRKELAEKAARQAEEEERKAQRLAESAAREAAQKAEAERLLLAADAARKQASWDDALKFYNQAYLLSNEIETAAMKTLLESIKAGREQERQAEELKRLKSLIANVKQDRDRGDIETAFNKANAVLENLRNDTFNLRGEVLALRDDIKTQLDAERREKTLSQRRAMAKDVLKKMSQSVADYDRTLLLYQNYVRQLAKKQSRSARYSEVQEDEREIERLAKEISDLRLDIIGYLKNAEDLDPTSRALRRAWADYYERDLKRAEALRDDAGAAVAAKRGASYDDEGRYRLLFNERGLFKNSSKALDVFVRALKPDTRGLLKPSGDRIMIPHGKEEELARGRYVIYVGAEPYHAIQLKRGETFELSVEEQLFSDSSLAYVPSGSTYDKNHNKDETETPGFWMMKREVTCGEYLEFLNAIPRRDVRMLHAPRDMINRKPIWGADGRGRFRLIHNFRESREGQKIDPMLPVYGISYQSVKEFIRWKNLEFIRQGKKRRWRLPTELEWRLAAQSGDGRIYPWGDRPDMDGSICHSARALQSDANKNVRSAEIIKPVVSFESDCTVHGIYDLGGSLSEFVDEVDALRGLVMICGGSFQDNDDFRFRTTSVRYVDTEKAFIQVGFRLVLDLDKSE